ncbi:metallophosphoesterase family protein [Amycolatopsis benzoatilytica]|uniref:metallophosphoesterase family protein n=1 Tax=Amycolatopsis benzoatilytica TaxID=346045 RepID=UPI00037078AA|nr:metallophosphoesterase family protein [Amycolatopsis benzoatilytica]
MGSAVYFTSDTHFDHEMVAGLRGFGAPAEHDEEIVARWNRTVSPGDEVWHLGDVGIGRLARSAPWLAQLNGTIHLVTGNHDAPWPGNRGAYRHQRAWLEHFETVQAFARRKIAGQQVLLSHFPFTGDHTGEDRYTRYRLPDPGDTWLLHGHVHDEWKVNGRQINVGADVWDLAPVPLAAIEDLVRAQRA